MYDELDRLLKLTKRFEANSTTAEMDDDLPATIYTFDEKGNPESALSTDASVSSDDNDATDDIGIPDDDKPFGSSGNKTVKDDDLGPLFEPDGCQPNEGELDGESIGMPSLRKEMKFSLTDAVEMGMGREFARKIKLEAANPLFVSNAPFKLGDVVSCDDNQMLYVVKNTDGTTITAAKPTANTAEHCKCKDGCWPEFTFSTDEIKPVANASIADANNLMAFNDQFRGFDGTIEDKAPMDRAQEYARKQTIQDISQDLDEILGQYKAAARGDDKEFTYTGCSPTVVFRHPDGSVSTEQRMGGYQIKWGD